MKNNSKNTGFIKISRDFLYHPLYANGEPFNLKEIMIDLTIRAFHSNVTKNYRNKMKHYKRGQVEGAYREFAEWWCMSKDTAKKRLEELQKEGFIYLDSSNEQTVITLVNYGLEQDNSGLGVDTDSYAKSYAVSYTESYTDSDNIKNDKECNKNDKKIKKNNFSDF